MPDKNFETPQSDFDRYEDKQKDMSENLKTGEGIYVKGEKRNEKGKE